jgi:hypothetical protein
VLSLIFAACTIKVIRAIKLLLYLKYFFLNRLRRWTTSRQQFRDLLAVGRSPTTPRKHPVQGKNVGTCLPSGYPQKIQPLRINSREIDALKYNTFCQGWRLPEWLSSKDSSSVRCKINYGRNFLSVLFGGSTWAEVIDSN